jgi:hypothetical protein
MGLDIQLYRLPADINIGQYLSYCAVIDALPGRWSQHPIPSPEKDKAMAARCEEIAVEMGLPPDIEMQVYRREEEVSLPSLKHPNSCLIGYIRSGYGGGGLDSVLRATLERGLYDIFPQAEREQNRYIRPDWRQSRQVAEAVLSEFLAGGMADAKFLKSIGSSVELAQAFIQRFNQPTADRQWFDQLQETTTDASYFLRYVEQLEGVIEMIEYVLAQPDSDQYLLYWGA